MLAALRKNWPEYLIEAWALGVFMISAGLFTTLFESPGSALNLALPDATLRRALIGVAMGLTAIGLIYSPWGKRSGAHMNPAVTLAFWRLGKIAPCDAVCYALAQFAGGTLGVLLIGAVMRDAFTAPPVHYVTTIPGAHGEWAAFGAEFIISALLMSVVLQVSNSRYAKFTGLCAGFLVATYIAVEAPLSGMSMNPARSFASAFPANTWTGFWIYLTAPILGMQCAASIYLLGRTAGAPGCGKLVHTGTQRCIHCGYTPE
jgi:aquaporin Z